MAKQFQLIDYGVNSTNARIMTTGAFRQCVNRLLLKHGPWVVLLNLKQRSRPYEGMLVVGAQWYEIVAEGNEPIGKRFLDDFYDRR